MSIGASSITLLDATSGLFSGYGIDIRSGSGLVYATSGEAIDPGLRQRVKQFPVSGLVTPDPTIGQVFYLTQENSQWTLAAFDRTTLSSLWRFVVPDNSGTPSSLVSCGSGLLAFQTSDGKIFIINTATLPNQFLANLSLAESASPNPATPGAAVTFTTTVTNRGPARATGVVLTNALPGGTSLISLASSQGVCTNDGGTLVCTLGTLDAGASATMTFVVLPAAGGTVRAVSGVVFSEQDPDASDNIATGVTYVQESRSDGIQTFQLATSDLVYDPFGKRLYLSVPAGTVGEGNSIMTLDPVTGMIGSPLPVGNGPDKLALSGDGQIPLRWPGSRFSSTPGSIGYSDTRSAVFSREWIAGGRYGGCAAESCRGSSFKTPRGWWKSPARWCRGLRRGHATIPDDVRSRLCKRHCLLGFPDDTLRLWK